MSFLNLLKGRKNKPKTDVKSKKEAPKDKKIKIKRKKKRELNRENDVIIENNEVVKEMKENLTEDKSSGFKLGKKKMRNKDNNRSESNLESIEIIDLNSDDK